MRLRQLVVFGSFLCAIQGLALGEASVKGLALLKAELETYVNDPSMLRKASNLFVKDIVPLAQQLYEGLVKDFFVNGHINKELNTELHGILKDLSTTHRSTIYRACGWGDADEILIRAKVQSGYEQLDEISERVRITNDCRIITENITKDQAEALYHSAIAQKNLKFHIYLASFVASPKWVGDRETLVTRYDPSITEPLLQGLVAPITADYADFLEKLTALCKAFTEVKDLNVFHYIYAELMGHWEYIMLLPQTSHRALATRMTSDMITLVRAEVNALLEKASTIVINSPSAPTTPYHPPNSSSLKENESSFKLKMSSLASRVATVSNRRPQITPFTLRDYYSVHEFYSINRSWIEDCFKPNVVSLSQAQKDILLLRTLLMQDPKSIESSLRSIRRLYREALVKLKSTDSLNSPSSTEILVLGRHLFIYNDLIDKHLSVEQRQRIKIE